MAGGPVGSRPGRAAFRRLANVSVPLMIAVIFVLCLPAWAGEREHSASNGAHPAEAAGLPRIGHSDTLIEIEALRFAPVPSVVYFTIFNDYDAGVLDWEIFLDRSWLSATPARAVSNSTDVAIWVVDTDSDLGRHIGHIVIESESAVNSPDTVWVQLDMLCPVQVLGDANWDGRLSQADIIYVVNHVLRGGPPPQPVWQSGDINCDEVVSQSDIIALVNHLLRPGPPPCNVCQFF